MLGRMITNYRAIKGDKANIITYGAGINEYEMR